MTIDDAVQALQECAKETSEDVETLGLLHERSYEAFGLINEFCIEIKSRELPWERILRSLIAGDTATRDAAVEAHFEEIAASDPIRHEARRMWMSGENPFGMKR